MKGRVVFIDYLRAVACFMVMMVHVTENFYIMDYAAGENMVRIADDANRFWIALWNGGIARTCVRTMSYQRDPHRYCLQNVQSLFH